MEKMIALKELIVSAGILLVAPDAQAEPSPAPAHLLDDFEWSYCDDPKRLDENGAIVRFASRYYRMCTTPIHPHGERMSLLRVNHKMKQIELGIFLFRSVRLNAQQEWVGSFERNLHHFLDSGTKTFGEVVYRKFDVEVLTSYGSPTVSRFVYDPYLNPNTQPLPEHWMICTFPKEEKGVTVCNLFSKYKDITVSAHIRHGGELFKPVPWDRFPDIALQVVELVEFADVTDHREHWPKGVPVFD